MDIIINGFRTPYIPDFTGSPVNITKEQILKLRSLGKTEKEISKEFGVSPATYFKIRKQLGITSKADIYKKELGKISKEQFEDFLKRKVPIDEVCSLLKITTTAYYNLMKKFGLRGYILGTNRRAVTKEQLQELVDSGLPIDKICEKLKISSGVYYTLVRELDINTVYRENRKHTTGITKQMILELLEQGKSHSEICKILKTSTGTLTTLLTKFHIKTEHSKSRETISQVTKEQLEKLVKSGKSATEICKELNIKIRAYSSLLTRFGIMTTYKKGKANLAKVSKEELQNLVDNGFTPDEICRRLNINENGFYKLLKRLNIRYNYQHHHGEINISKPELEDAVNNWESVQAIEDRFGVTNGTFYEKAKLAGVRTVLRDSLDRINEINPKEIQEVLNQGVSRTEICKKYDITENMYHTLIQKYNLVSKSKQKFQNSGQITKEQIESMIKAGKSTMEICKELNISPTTYTRKLHKFGLKSEK